MDRKPRLITRLKDLFEDVAGFDLADADSGANFIELGLDSLMLTQVALQLQKSLGSKVSFRQLMGECSTLDRLAARLDDELPPEAAPARSEEHTSELQSLMRISYAVFCLKKNKLTPQTNHKDR